ncbi:ABC transporter ATP-binding protein [Rhodococcoides yunnanense]|uniref:ABC transporter ATP-binding protein n=1 Tax=Rhodococcoides yunnanense TaxID=278209 RepID=UPI0009325C6C|nr:ABC transporter ATP-binding protein [Rhodococcus yunnanensis]
MKEVMLDCQGLAVVYNRTAVGVDDVTFQVDEGEIVALVGPNGAGKSTTLRAIGGFLKSEAGTVSAGNITLFGSDITGEQPFSIARRGVALIPEDDKIFRNLTVEENLEVAPGSKKDQSKMIEFALDVFPILEEKWKVPGGLLSGGQRQMLAISMALSNTPKLLLADELSQGIAPVLVTEIMRAVARINAELNVGVLLVEQNVRAALGIAGRVNVIEGGKVVWRGTADDARDDDAFTKAYMGLTEDSAEPAMTDVKGLRK